MTYVFVALKNNIYGDIYKNKSFESSGTSNWIYQVLWTLILIYLYWWAGIGSLQVDASGCLIFCV